MIKIKEAVIVEGKYDKLKLENLLDTLIITTNGFSLYKDKQRLRFIKKLALERGIIVLTDSDHAGFQIRSFIAGAVPKDRIKHVYIPDIMGKEKRKPAPSKEGKLGVEGINSSVLLSAFEKAGVFCKQTEAKAAVITSAMLYNDGIMGKSDSKSMRMKLLKKLDLPEFLSTNALLNVLNQTLTLDEYNTLINEITNAK